MDWLYWDNEAKQIGCIGTEDNGLVTLGQSGVDGNVHWTSSWCSDDGSK